MARDTLTVPCTGAGVERQFSKSRRATPWTRARLSPETFGQIMMYKDYLHRKDQPNPPPFGSHPPKFWRECAIAITTRDASNSATITRDAGDNS